MLNYTLILHLYIVYSLFTLKYPTLIDIILNQWYNLSVFNSDRLLHTVYLRRKNMKKRLISLCLAVILSASLLAIPANAASGGATTTSALNLRASAGTDAKILLTMPQGAKVIVHSTSNGWSKVTYNGTDGYASADYLSASSAVSSDFGTGTITGSDVRMRSGPGTSHSVLGTYPKGTQMKVTGVEGNWYAVNYDGKDGYVSSDFMKVTSSAASSSSTSQTTTSSSGTSGKGKVTGSSVNMRSGAGTSYSVLATFAKGTEVEITGKTGNWYAIRHNGKSGYISADYLSVSSSSSSSTTTSSSGSTEKGKTGSVIGTSVRMRSGPGTNYDTLGYYSNGVTMTVLGSENGWYKVSYNGKTGYIIAQYFRVNPESTGTTEGEIRGSDVNMRLGPGTNYGIVATYQKGTKVNVSGTSGDWYEVSVNGKYGYIKKDFVKVSSSSSEDEPEDVPAPTQTLNETGIIHGTSVRMRGGPGTNYAVVGYLNNGTKVSITGKTGNWYAIKYNGTNGYVSSDYVSISSSSSQASQIIATAKEYLGTPYVYGGTSPKGFDCSGLIYYVFKQYGYSLYRCADDMYYHDGVEVSKSELIPGDLVFFSSASYPVGHVGMYIGNNQFIHASSGSGKVVITNLTGVQYYETHYVGAKRVLK